MVSNVRLVEDFNGGIMKESCPFGLSCEDEQLVIIQILKRRRCMDNPRSGVLFSLHSAQRGILICRRFFHDIF